MNYQILLESYAAGEGISEDEWSSIESIQSSRKRAGCTEKAPKHICGADQVCEGSSWITCFASILDKANPLSLGNKSRGAKVIDALLENNYLMN